MKLRLTPQTRGPRRIKVRPPSLSARYPKRGWVMEDEKLRIVARMPAWVKVSWNFSTRRGSMGGRKAG
jgi:hypothetical protein